MEPEIKKLPELTLVGIVGCGPDVSQVDIAGLWERFIQQDASVQHQVEEKGYEVHIQEETNPAMHFCLVGVEVSKIEGLPIEMFVKVLPACDYAVFTHQFKDGSYGVAFKKAYDWVANSQYVSAYPYDIQCYDSRFKSPDDPESVFEICLPIRVKMV